jgi:ribosome-associated toxin RatA of RatAB toxin-antitoxin module
MREVNASATGAVAANVEQCYALLVDVGRYPEWYPAGAKRVDVVESDDQGRASVVDALLSLGQGPIRKDFEMQLAVTYRPNELVELSRLESEAKGGESITVTWTLAPQAEAGSTELTVAFAAKLDLPPFIPINPIVDAVAQDLLATAQKAAVDQAQ